MLQIDGRWTETVNETAKRAEREVDLRAWLTQTDIFLHPNLEIIRTREGTSIHAISHCELNTCLARIPKRAVLSHRTTSLPPDRLSLLPPDTSPTQRLAVCLLHEVLLGSSSKWATYIDHLPPEVVPIASLWPKDGDAWRWSRETELQRELDELGVDPDTLASFYANFALPVLVPPSSALPSSPSPPSLARFLHAYSLVSSRAFQVDSWHSLALVPLADLFNHTDDHDVQFESEHWVCAECGDLDQCSHDDDDGEGGNGARPEPASLKEIDTCELVSVTTILADQEVSNTYGPLPNARLLVFYGFQLEANKHDVATFSFDNITRLVVLPDRVDHLKNDWTALVALWHSSRGGEDDEEGLVKLDARGGLYIDADARLSSGLWLLLILSHVALPSAPAKRLAFLRRIEAAQSRGAEDETVGQGLDPLDQKVLRLVVEAVRALCANRIRAQHESEQTGRALLELAEQSEEALTRLAIKFTAGERMLLECVSETWSQLLG